MGKWRASILEINSVTADVKEVLLKVVDADFAFLAGQCVYFFAPGVEKSAALSIASTPLLLKQTRSFHVVVKNSRFPPIAWIHNEAKPGDDVEVTVGGTLTMTPDEQAGPLLFIAGGIGITPLYSLLRDTVEQQSASVCATLLYMACGPQAHVLWQRLLDLEELAKHQGSCLRCVFFDTSKDAAGKLPHSDAPIAAPGCWGAFSFLRSGKKNAVLPADTLVAGKEDAQSVVVAGAKSHVKPSYKVEKGRVGPNQLKQALADLGHLGASQSPTAFLCGPPQMSDALEGQLLQLGLPKNSVRLERWW
ncbi:hypothetical protein CYMTET_2964 [Cymbomonas tetramitiformis]|uniref:FAD-binding FR-type domain-containing protein n=1 Tax=Cymbomonas tetramitiformis TaxID=36881 RepID=A0AAE0H417_9CHLO|nr:hypothetical protein CYMTET_2964 [Cymbomonas tetramitiformis]